VIPPALLIAWGGVSELLNSPVFRQLQALHGSAHFKDWALLLISPDPVTAADSANLNAQELAQRLQVLTCQHFLAEELTLIQQALTELNQRYALHENYLFYPLRAEFSPLLRLMHALGLSRPPEVRGFRRILLEMPVQTRFSDFHHSARELKELFREEQIFRRSYGLSRGMLEQILALRFANGIWEPLWNRYQIQQIEITLGEQALPPPAQSGFGPQRLLPLIQLLALTAMEAPVQWDAESLHNELFKLLLALRPIARRMLSEVSLRGRREALPADCDLPETFIALRLAIDNARWQGTPFYLRAAAGVPEDRLEIVIHFQPSAQRLFTSAAQQEVQNQLVIRFLPEFQLQLRLGAHQPQTHERGLAPVQAVSALSPGLSGFGVNAAQLLLDVLRGERTLFLNHDAAAHLACFLDPLHQFWREGDTLYTYPPTRWGPGEAESLFEDLHSQWWEP
jgi:glucose-6-phosphate 1-dehydrogenase